MVVFYDSDFGVILYPFLDFVIPIHHPHPPFRKPLLLLLVIMFIERSSGLFMFLEKLIVFECCANCSLILSLSQRVASLLFRNVSDPIYFVGLVGTLMFAIHGQTVCCCGPLCRLFWFMFESGDLLVWFILSLLDYRLGFAFGHISEL